MSGSTALETALALLLVYAVLALFVAGLWRAIRLLLALPSLERALGWARRRAPVLIVALAIVVVGALNADTLLVVRGLSGGAPPVAAARAGIVPSASALTATPSSEATAAAGAGREGVFISYSHRDTEWLDALRVALKPIERANGLAVWDDREIAPGREWEREILDAVRRSRVAVLLVSPDFLASDYVANVELPAIMTARADGLSVLWVPLRYSGYEVTVLSQLQAATNPATPLASLPAADQDRVIVDIARHIAAMALGQPAAAAPAATTIVPGPPGRARAGVPLGWDNAYERLEWRLDDVVIKVLGLALTVIVVAALAPLWLELLSRAPSTCRGERRPPA